MNTSGGSLRDRGQAALIVAVVAGAYALARAVHEPNWPTDFDQLWHAARALISGGRPYEVVGPGKSFEWLWPLYYPLPAVVLAAPLAGLPVAAARVVFSSMAGAALGWGLGDRIRTFWPMLLSASFLIATSRTQWSPFMLATMWFPVAGVAVAAKPNVGIAILAALRGRDLAVALAAAAAITLVSIILHPTWIHEWRVAISDAPHVVAPIAMPFGFLLALAGLRWRRSDARLLLALALIPHTPSLYDLLPLFYLCRTLRESLALSVMTHALWWGFIAFTGGPTFDTYATALGRVSTFAIYLPALAAILARPNVAVDVVPAEAPPSRALPVARVDVALSLLLLIGAFMLVWLPLVTRR